MLLSLKKLKKLVTLVGQAKSDDQKFNFYSPEVGEFFELYQFFVKKKMCSYVKDDAIKLAKLMKAIQSFNDNRVEIISDIIKTLRWLRLYLIMHSVFSIHTNKDKFVNEDGEEKSIDWFAKLMSRLLQPSEEDIEFIRSRPKIPDGALSYLSIFDPQPITNFEDFFDDKIISFHLWGDYKNGESYYPIEVNDRKWMTVGDGQKARLKNKDFIAKFKILESPPCCDDIPF